MDDSQRIKEIERYTGLSTRALALEIGLKTPQTLYDIHKGKHGISKDVARAITAKYLNINPDWLLLDVGDMLKSGIEESKEQVDYLLVPMYNLDARGGFGGNDEVDIAEYVIDRIPFKNADPDDICVPITGNSMAPTYGAGSIVLLHHVAQWSDFLELGQVYMIVLKDGRRLIKELRASQEDKKTKYLCVSHNPTFDPVELPKDLISRVFLVRAVYAKTAM